MKEIKEIKEITVFFVSGLDFTFPIHNDIWDLLLKDLKQTWSIGTITSDYGINWEKVTHFRVREK